MSRITVTGQLICADEAEAEVVVARVDEHIRLSRGEPGCLRFDITRSADPLIWDVSELYTEAAAFQAHKARTAASPWAEATRSIRRDITVAPAAD